ncbi:hypothetical protein BDZ45DRAFT_748989 [Acephala macrosclerotiorum]|nr:hypothetical protein BDZ45DRAFT_748989 [Acephala macrosclerotiorum]
MPFFPSWRWSSTQQHSNNNSISFACISNISSLASQRFYPELGRQGIFSISISFYHQKVADLYPQIIRYSISKLLQRQAEVDDTSCLRSHNFNACSSTVTVYYPAPLSYAEPRIFPVPQFIDLETKPAICHPCNQRAPRRLGTSAEITLKS